MKNKDVPHGRVQHPAGGAPAGSAAPAEHHHARLTPSVQEVARQAYYNYINHGSQPGHDVKHWLDAEAQLLTERTFARQHEHATGTHA